MKLGGFRALPPASYDGINPVLQEGNDDDEGAGSVGRARRDLVIFQHLFTTFDFRLKIKKVES